MAGRPRLTEPRIEARLTLRFDLNDKVQRAVYGFLTYDKYGESSKGNAKSVIMQAVLEYMNKGINDSERKQVPEAISIPQIEEKKAEKAPIEENVREKAPIIEHEDLSGELEEIEEMFGGA